MLSAWSTSPEKSEKKKSSLIFFMILPLKHFKWAHYKYLQEFQHCQPFYISASSGLNIHIGNMASVQAGEKATAYIYNEATDEFNSNHFSEEVSTYQQCYLHISP